MKISLFFSLAVLSLAHLSADTPKEIIAKKYDPNKFFLGATLNHSQLGTKSAELFKQLYTNTCPENCSKQSDVYKELGGEWNWKKSDEYVSFAKENNILVRAHGPISPQVSKWVKEDERTPEELTQMLDEFFTAYCKRYNDEPAVRWIDVVNETIKHDGSWMTDRPGSRWWENPWFKIGLNEDEVPIYIVRAFEIANKHATNKKLIYNQNGSMKPEMWAQIKKTILYLKEKGLRVDGIGWQGHLKKANDPAHKEEDLKYLGELIDWAHENDLEFHVTELDYWVETEEEKISLADQEYQAKGLSNILKVLLSRRHSGVVALNFWSVQDKKRWRKTSNIFDIEGNPKLAYEAIINTLNNPTEEFEFVVD